MLQTVARKTAGIIGRETWLIRQMRPFYEALLNLTNHGRGIPWTINGVEFRIDPRQRHRLGHDYDTLVAAFLRKHVKPGDICLDVGANVGVYVLQFAHWVGPTGKAIAFEPNPLARSILQKHIELNGINEQTQVVPAAVGAAAGEAVLYAADADGMSRLGSPNQAIADRVSKITVPVITLDKFCEEESLKPDWLFIDIEGFEIAALAGARELITGHGKSLGIIVEMHPNVWDTADTTRAKAEALLAELRLRAIPLMGQTDPLGDYGLVYLAHQ
ncbi:MAG: hypothetical protein DMF68_16695 [Acidobacteria bacterium]|nr:MAG: hypothetical protein DMF68_16695 [Acidobacteriota bacterium]